MTERRLLWFGVLGRRLDISGPRSQIVFSIHCVAETSAVKWYTCYQRNEQKTRATTHPVDYATPNQMTSFGSCTKTIPERPPKLSWPQPRRLKLIKTSCKRVADCLFHTKTAIIRPALVEAAGKLFKLVNMPRMYLVRLFNSRVAF